MITKRDFGAMPDGQEVSLYTLENDSGMTASVCTYGAILQSLRVPDRDGILRDVVLGYDTLEEYLQNDGYLGATVGRFANRLKNARFPLNGKVYNVTCNDGANSLHGGAGFSSKVWQAEIQGETLELSCLSPDGDDGYPGTLFTRVRVSLDAENGLHLDYAAQSSADTIINLTNHTYFNLHGGTKPMLSHELWLNAREYTATDETLIPVADVPVAGTDYDFTAPRQVARPACDNNFNLLGGSGVQASVYEPETGILLEMYTDRPCVQVYTSTMLSPRKGKNGCEYTYGYGLCLETQVAPNAPNRPGFDGYVLRQGEIHRTATVYRFSVK